MNYIMHYTHFYFYQVDVAKVHCALQYSITTSFYWLNTAEL